MSKIRKMPLKDFCNIFNISYVIAKEPGEDSPWIAQIEGMRVIDNSTEGSASISISGSNKNENTAINAMQNLVDKLNMSNHVFCEIHGSPIKLPLLSLN